MNSTQLTTVNTQQQVALGDMERMATAITKSGLFGIKTPDQALALMIVAQAENKHPGTVASEYHIIQGRASLKADAMLARFQSAGGRVEWNDHSNEKVSATFSHPAGGSLKVDWDMARAKAAGLGTKDNWRSYPRQMLRARVISEGVRAVYPGVLQGMYTPEEVGEFRNQPMREAEPVLLEVETPEPAPVKKPRRKAAPKQLEQPAQPAQPEQPADWAAELEKRVFEHEPQVNSFLAAKGLIGEGQTFRDLKDDAYIARVMKNTPGFIDAVLKATEMKEAA